MPSFTNFTRGTLVTATFLNQVEKGLAWVKENVLRLAMELALQGIAPAYVSLFYDLFGDTSEFDSAAVTPDLSIDTANGVLELPGGFSTNTDYYYQSVLHTVPATVTKANMLLLRESITNTNVYPSLSCVGSGAGAAFVEKTVPVASRTITSTLDQWSEDYGTTGNSGSYTVEFDTDDGKILLPGGSTDSWVTPAQQTSNAVADIVQHSGGAVMRTNGGVSTCFLPDGSMAIAYASREFSATITNIRLRVLKTDGTLKTWAGNSYLDITTDGTVPQFSPVVLPISDGNVGIVWSSNSGTMAVNYMHVTIATGTLGTPFSSTFIANGCRWDAAIELDTNFVVVGGHNSGAAKIEIFRFAHNAASFGAAVASTASTGSVGNFRLSIDQEDDVHIAYQDNTNNLIRCNIWDKSAAAWLYTFGAGDKTIARTVSAPTVDNDFKIVADINQSGSNKFSWVVYTKNNGSTKSAVYMRTIHNGTVSSETTVKSDATNNMLWVNGAYDPQNSVLHVLYADSANGLRTCTVTAAGSVGAETTIKASATTAASGICVNSDQTALGLAFRDGADANTASEVLTSSKVLGYTLTAKTWQSVVRTLSTTATKFFVSADQNLPTNTTATWQISADNGSNWTSVTLNSQGTFGTPGNQIILKVTLQTTNSAVTPEVDRVDWKALLPLVEEEYEWTGLSGVDVKIKLRGRSSNASFNPQVHSVGVVVA